MNGKQAEMTLLALGTVATFVLLAINLRGERSSMVDYSLESVDEDSPSYIIVYAPTHCEGCSELWDRMLKYQAQGPSARPPLEVRIGAGAHGTRTALALECARVHRRFWEAAAVLVGSEYDYDVRRLASSAGIQNEPDFIECIESEREAWTVESGTAFLSELRTDGVAVAYMGIGGREEPLALDSLMTILSK